MNSKKFHFESSAGSRAGRKMSPAIADYAPAFFGLLATRLTDRIVEEGANVADARGIETPPRCMSTMVTLARGPMGVSEISRAIGISHVAVMKNTRRLTNLGLVRTGRDPSDARRKPIELTPKGERAAFDVIEFVTALQEVYREIFAEIGVDAYDALEKFDEALDRQSFFDRLDKVTQSSGNCGPG